jgi:hypothetical protein
LELKTTINALNSLNLLYNYYIMENENARAWPRYAVYSFITLVILLLFLVLVLYLMKSPLVYRSSAYSTTNTTSTVTLITPTPNATATPQSMSPSISLDNSYVFASPLTAEAGGEKIRITVYTLDDRGLGISGKTVSIGGEGSQLQITPVQPVTDGQGRSTFDVASNTPGTYIIQAAVDGTNLNQQANITFN